MFARSSRRFLQSNLRLQQRFNTTSDFENIHKELRELREQNLQLIKYNQEKERISTKNNDIGALICVMGGGFLAGNICGMLTFG